MPRHLVASMPCAVLVVAFSLAARFLAACGDDAAAADHDASASDAGDDGLGPTSSSVHVMTHDGLVHGTLAGTTRSFLGIPYAKPPIGELRWASPRAVEPWKDERETTAFGPACMQQGVSDASEDCLSVNVWAPDVSKTKPHALRPTMVWLHGGAFVVGSNALYDGTPLVERGDVVLVAVNYRLGAFGFLAHPALSSDPDGRGSSGNYGIEDQILALQWVKQNIRAFGGDPDNVTLFGESAGSACTCVLLATPKAQGLVDQAIMESGACLGFESSLADAEARGEKIAASIGCDDDATALTCMRGKSALDVTNATSDILTALLHQPWRPIVDGVVVPKLTDVAPVKVPIIIGTNRNEGGAFGLLAATEAAFKSRVNGYYPNAADAAKILDAYNATKNGSWAGAFSALTTDSLFVCPTRKLARAAADAHVATYMYSFSNGEAYHADEVPYVFGLPSVTGDAKKVSDDMLMRWTTFAKNGDPNLDGKLAWPKFETDNDQHMVFDVTPQIGSGLKRDACDLLDTLPALQF